MTNIEFENHATIDLNWHSLFCFPAANTVRQSIFTKFLSKLIGLIYLFTIILGTCFPSRFTFFTKKHGSQKLNSWKMKTVEMSFIYITFLFIVLVLVRITYCTYVCVHGSCFSLVYGSIARCKIYSTCRRWDRLPWLSWLHIETNDLLLQQLLKQNNLWNLAKVLIWIKNVSYWKYPEHNIFLVRNVWEPNNLLRDFLICTGAHIIFIFVLF